MSKRPHGKLEDPPIGFYIPPYDLISPGSNSLPDLPPISRSVDDSLRTSYLAKLCASATKKLHKNLAASIELQTPSIAELASSPSSSDPLSPLPWDLIEGFGALSYRMLCRLRDFYKTHNEPIVAVFANQKPVQASDPFLTLLLQVSLRRMLLLHHKKSLNSAADQYRQLIHTLRNADGTLVAYQSLAQPAGTFFQDNPEHAAWRRDVLASTFHASTVDAEIHDRFATRAREEKELVRAATYVLEYVNTTAKDDSFTFPEFEPNLNSRAWQRCLDAVSFVYSLRHEPLHEVVRFHLARALWLFALMMWKDWDRAKAYESLVLVYCNEIFRAARHVNLKGSSSDSD